MTNHTMLLSPIVHAINFLHSDEAGEINVNV